MSQLSALQSVGFRFCFFELGGSSRWLGQGECSVSQHLPRPPQSSPPVHAQRPAPRLPALSECRARGDPGLRRSLTGSTCGGSGTSGTSRAASACSPRAQPAGAGTDAPGHGKTTSYLRGREWATTTTTSTHATHLRAFGPSPAVACLPTVPSQILLNYSSPFWLER